MPCPTLPHARFYRDGGLGEVEVMVVVVEGWWLQLWLWREVMTVVVVMLVDGVCRGLRW